MEDNIVLEILELIRDESLSAEEFKKRLKHYHESDIADAIPLLSEKELNRFTSMMSDEDLGELLSFVDSPEDYLEELPVERAADIVETMDADDAIDVLETMDEDAAQDIIEEMDKESREDIELIQKFDDDEIGSKITTNFISIKKSSTIKEAMKTLIKEAPENDNISNIFVLDENNKYYGTIILKDLIIARDTTDLLDITKTSYPTLYAHEKVDEVINEIKDIDLDIIPVLSESSEILGVITSQDIIETVDEEMGEDFVKFAGITEEADENDSILKSLAKRVPWLALLIVLDIFTSSALSMFEHVYSVLPGLVLFQSWILDSSGNAGTQSLALTIRAIADDKINSKTFGKRILRELLTGLLNGILIGLSGFLVSFIFMNINNSIEMAQRIQISLNVGIALLCAIPFSALAGLFIPVFFKKIKIDPAVASGPLITTLSDIVGVTIYYTIAILLGV